MYLEYLFSLFDDFLVCILESIEIAAGTHLTRDGTFYYIYPPFFPLSIASTSPKSRVPTGSLFSFKISESPVHLSWPSKRF